MDAHTPRLSAEDIAAFHANGYITVRGIVRPEELEEAAAVFSSLMTGQRPVGGGGGSGSAGGGGGVVPDMGKDVGEHTPGLMNVTAFTLYHPLDTLGVFAALEARCAAVAAQLYAGTGPPLARDYEQLLRKLPNRPDAVFPAHSDMNYWPRSASGAFDTRTATCSIAVNAASEGNGCLWVLPGSHKAGALYPGFRSTLEGSRPEGGGVINVAVAEEDLARRVWLPLAAGDMTVHEEWIVHGSGGNTTGRQGGGGGGGVTRDTLIFAFRPPSAIALERSLGFRHSYNDPPEVLRTVREHVFP
jgi:phytanoyl-CoA hydroxylase